MRPQSIADMFQAIRVFGICWVLACAAPAWAQITVTITKPNAANPYPTEPLAIQATVLSASEVVSVEASVQGHTTTLSSSATNEWAGTLPLVDLPRGTYELVVTARNAGGQTGENRREFVLDRLPVVTWISPAQDVLGQPDIRVTARCTDDGPSCRLEVYPLTGGVLQVGSGEVDTVVRPVDGARLLELRATDSTGRTTILYRRMFVHSSAKMSSVASFSGVILDINADRALVYEDEAVPRVLKIVDRATGSSQIIWTAPTADRVVSVGFLSPAGGLFGTKTSVLDETLHEWRSGTLIDLGSFSSPSLVVKGTWALWAVPLTLRDLTNGTNTVIPETGTIFNIFGGDVTPDGRVVFTGEHTSNGRLDVFEFHPGPPATTTQLTDGSPLLSVDPQSDGVNVVFERRQAGFEQPESIVLRTAAGDEIVLASGLESVAPGTHYRVAGGWVAFLRPGTGGSVQAWIRAPDGTERQLSSTGGTAFLEGLSETGEVVFSAASPGEGLQRYLARPGQANLNLGTPLGVPIWVDGALHVGFGPHLLAVDPSARSILSEGATGTFFTTDVAILNPNPATVPATITYLRENEPKIEETRDLPALSRTTIHVNELPGLEATTVSTVVNARDGAPLVVERLMSWDASAYGGHLATAVDRPRMRWLFAEGAQGFFDTFFLLANSGTSDATVRLTFLVEQGAPVTHTVTVQAASRKTVFAGDIAGLIDSTFATVVDSTLPIVAERAMYFGTSPLWYGGHGTAGVPDPSMTWFHAEGATGSFFDTFILLVNPHPVEVPVDVIFVTDANQVYTQPKKLAPMSRLTINVEDEQADLANAVVSTLVQSETLPVVSERAMYWGPAGLGWRDAHDSLGVTSSGVKWGLAEGRAGGARGYQTYVLVSNITANDATLRVTFVREDGTAIEQSHTVAARHRLTIDTTGIPELAGANFGTIVESTNGVPINVESAMYWNANGVTWEAGVNTPATRLQ